MYALDVLGWQKPCCVIIQWGVKWREPVVPRMALAPITAWPDNNGGTAPKIMA